ncbi:hypothetical protein K426_24474 [Sphingobium sp. TKS]|nr:hypothetical protein K426_24474 [Sphingobium sp. TKS]
MRWWLGFQALRGLMSVRPWRRGSGSDAAVARAIRVYLATAASHNRHDQNGPRSVLTDPCDRVCAHDPEDLPFVRSDPMCRRVKEETGLERPLDPVLKSAVDAMPPLTAAILALRVHHGMGVDAITERFAIPRWKIRMHLRRAIRTVAQSSAHEGMDFPG